MVGDIISLWWAASPGISSMLVVLVCSNLASHQQLAVNGRQSLESVAT
jgi:hypothetical protein